MKRIAAVFACLAFVFLPANQAVAEVDGDATTAGIETKASNQVLARANAGLDLVTGKADKRIFEYTSTTACPQSLPGSPSQNDTCLAAIQACAGNTPAQGLGPQLRVYRRQLDATGAVVTDWQPIGTTCLAELVPGKTALMDKILAAFHHTPWARPAIHIQPEGNITLVTLPTYFEVKWPTQGFKPGDVDTTTLLSDQVKIRPTVRGYTYDFGDGNSFGPTDSTGGTYPDGDVTHAYTTPGSHTARINIVYSGEYKIGTGPWTPINATAKVFGQPFPITVKTANARLVTN